VNPDHIDFISAYCDRWCERCPFTHRCSAFTAQIAIAMCDDDAEAGFELAFGHAPNDEGIVNKPDHSWLIAAQEEWTPADEAAFHRAEEARRVRIEETPLTQTARAAMDLAFEWLRDNSEALATQDDVVREALEVASHDSVLIAAKLHRALCGKYLDDENDEFDDPVQNDANGSAKVALISIARSIEAWTVLALATGTKTPSDIAVLLGDLRLDVEHEFPEAWRFQRPGFDERASASA
jgi:hypothetical protein